MSGSPVQIILAAVLGWLVGMLVNSLADSLPVQRRLSLPSCWSCRSRLPILRWVIPRRCPACQAKPQPRTWITLAAFTLAAAWLAYRPPAELGFWLGMLVLAYFGLVIIIDVEHRLILHPVSAFGASWRS